MFVGDVKSVSKTRIFVADVGTTRQVTVYANTVKLQGGRPTMMILPVPVSAATRAAGGETCGIEVFDMSRHRELFTMLDRAFPRMQDDSFDEIQLRGHTFGKSTLEVRRSGSYRYSIAPTREDIDRLHADLFTVSDELRAVLQREYTTEWAFLACVIDEDATFAPFAYAHDKLHGSMTVPTRHFHSSSVTGDKRPRWEIPTGGAALWDMATRDKSTVSAAKEDDGWDHEIYVLGALTLPPWLTAAPRGTVKIVSAQNGVNLRGLFDSKLPFALQGVARGSMFQKITISAPLSALPNEDMLFYCASQLVRWPRCSGTLFGRKVYALQTWYGCFTCEASGLFVDAQGACAACIRTCHADHDVYEAMTSRFFCDCGDKCGVNGHQCVATMHAAGAIAAPGRLRLPTMPSAGALVAPDPTVGAPLTEQEFLMAVVEEAVARANDDPIV